MNSKVTLASAAEMPAQLSTPPPPPSPAKGASGHASAPATAADYRLIIEEVGGSGHYVYTVVDRRTGAVVSQLPREEVLKMKDQPGYAAGALFNGEA